MSRIPKPNKYDLIDDNGELNQRLLRCIRNLPNVHLLNASGPTQTSKSTTLNAMTKMIKSRYGHPFKVDPDGVSSVTKGCQFFGPIKLTQIFNEEEIENIPDYENSYIFLTDTEGSDSLEGMTRDFIPAAITGEINSTLTFFITNPTVNKKDIELISSHVCYWQYFQMTALNIPIPTPLIYGKNYSPLYDRRRNKQQIFQEINTKRKNSETKMRKTIQEFLHQNQNMETTILDNMINVMGGPFDKIYFENDHNRNDPKFLVYKKSLKDILQGFKEAIIRRREIQSGQTLCERIQYMFNILNEYRNSADSKESSYENIINNFFRRKYEEKINQFRNHIQQSMNLHYCIERIDNIEIIRQELNEFVGQELFNVCQRLMGTELNYQNNLMINEIIENLRNTINNHKNEFSQALRSDETLRHYCKHLFEQLNDLQFRDDFLNINLDPEVSRIWEKVENDYSEIIQYLREQNDDQFSNIYNDFIDRIINRIWSTLCSLNELVNYKNEIKDEISEEMTNDSNNNKLNTLEYYHDHFINIISRTYTLSEERRNEVISIIDKAYPYNSSKEDSKGMNKWLIAGIISITAICIFCPAAYFLLKKIH